MKPVPPHWSAPGSEVLTRDPNLVQAYLLNSMANLSIMYMIAIEGWGAGRFGARYASMIDGLGSLVMAGLAGPVFVVWKAQQERNGSASPLL